MAVTHLNREPHFSKIVTLTFGQLTYGLSKRCSAFLRLPLMQSDVLLILGENKVCSVFSQCVQHADLQELWINVSEDARLHLVELEWKVREISAVICA